MEVIYLQSFLVTIGLGLSFFGLALFHLTLGVPLNTDLMIGLSVGSMLFSISDIIQFFSEMPHDNSEKEKRLTEKSENSIAIVVIGAICSMIFLPNSGLLEFLPKFIYDRLGDSATLFGLGFSIVQISFKSALQIRQEKRRISNENEELKNDNEKLRQTLKEQMKVVQSEIVQANQEVAMTVTEENELLRE